MYWEGGVRRGGRGGFDYGSPVSVGLCGIKSLSPIKVWLWALLTAG